MISHINHGIWIIFLYKEIFLLEIFLYKNERFLMEDFCTQHQQSKGFMARMYDVILPKCQWWCVKVLTLISLWKNFVFLQQIISCLATVIYLLHSTAYIIYLYYLCIIYSYYLYIIYLYYSNIIYLYYLYIIYS